MRGQVRNEILSSACWMWGGCLVLTPPGTHTHTHTQRNAASSPVGNAPYTHTHTHTHTHSYKCSLQQTKIVHPLSLWIWTTFFNFFVETGSPFGNWNNAYWTGHPQTALPPSTLREQGNAKMPKSAGELQCLSGLSTQSVLEPPGLFTPA